MFNKKFDRNLNKLLEKLPDANIGYLIVGLNTFFYLLSWVIPPNQLWRFYQNCMFSSYGLQSGAIWSLLLCHFTHDKLLDYVLKSVIVFMFCQNLSQFNGGLFVQNMVLPSNNQGRAFGGNDAILQGLLFTLIF